MSDSRFVEKPHLARLTENNFKKLSNLQVVSGGLERLVIKRPKLF